MLLSCGGLDSPEWTHALTLGRIFKIGQAAADICTLPGVLQSGQPQGVAGMQELSLLVAAHWVELQDPEETQPYYYNPITGRTQWIKPEAPTKIPLDDEGTMLLAEEEHDRVMPSRSIVKAAGRYDLHHAIVYHGGYREVGSLLFCVRMAPKPSVRP